MLSGELRYDGCLTEDPDVDSDGYWVVSEWSKFTESSVDLDIWYLSGVFNTVI